jgi:hypothetical protein
MVAWERQLRPAELMAVTSYVGTLLDTDPPNAKAPQGDEVDRTPPSDAVPAEAPAAGDAGVDAAADATADAETVVS